MSIGMNPYFVPLGANRRIHSNELDPSPLNMCGEPATDLSYLVFVTFACPTSMTLTPEGVPETYDKFGAPPSAYDRGVSHKLESARTQRRASIQDHLSEIDRMTEVPFTGKLSVRHYCTLKGGRCLLMNHPTVLDENCGVARSMLKTHRVLS